MRPALHLPVPLPLICWQIPGSTTAEGLFTLSVLYLANFLPNLTFALSQLCLRRLLFSISTSEWHFCVGGGGRALSWELFEICCHLASSKFPAQPPCCLHVTLPAIADMTALNWYFKLIDFLPSLLVLQKMDIFGACFQLSLSLSVALRRKRRKFWWRQWPC